MLSLSLSLISSYLFFYFFISSIVSELLRTQYLYTSVLPPTALFPIANMKSFEDRKICPTEIRMNHFCRNWLKVTTIERKRKKYDNNGFVGPVMEPLLVISISSRKRANSSSMTTKLSKENITLHFRTNNHKCIPSIISLDGDQT